jgi:hypothetical protein
VITRRSGVLLRAARGFKGVVPLALIAWRSRVLLRAARRFKGVVPLALTTGLVRSRIALNLGLPPALADGCVILLARSRAAAVAADVVALRE